MDERVGILLLNFGEPADPDLESVTEYLERIFLQNAGLEAHEDGRARARALAQARAPGLLEEYREIGGSPLNRQAEAQADALRQELEARGFPARVYSAYQFTSPFIGDAVDEAHRQGVETLVALPVYPICGQSTTVAALDEAARTVAGLPSPPQLVCLSGWHHHPQYVGLRVANIREFCEKEDLDPTRSDTLLYFSVHGTPVRYLDEGNRYDRYVFEHCRDVAEALGVSRYAVGFQNHTNRRIAWTQPDNEDRIREAPERRLVVVPISFMHEQSETLAELDGELKEFAESQGKEFHRVPVPHDASAFTAFLADLAESAMAAHDGRGAGVLTPCRCRPVRGTWCTNGARDLPPSPYVPAEAATS